MFCIVDPDYTSIALPKAKMVVASLASAAAGAGLATTAQDDAQLAALMAKGADLQLQFDGEQLAPAHAVMLRMWSGVLRRALDSDKPVTGSHSSCVPSSTGTSSSSSSSSAVPGSLRVIPMPGTSKADWLAVARFIYPITPLPEVTWSNLEALLTLGSKLDMPAILARAERFVRSSTASMDNSPSSKLFVWRWLRLTDQAGLDEACKLCADKAVALARGLGVAPECIQGLSTTALQYLVLRLAPMQCGQPECPRCGSSRTFKCSYCGHCMS